MTAVRAIGIATGMELPMAKELSGAVVSACLALGIDVRSVRSAGDTRGLDAILGISYPKFYPVLWDAGIGAPRLAWLGEPLPPAGERTIERRARPLRLGRVVDAVIVGTTLGHRRPAAGWLIRSREWIAQARDQTSNLEEHRAAARAGIRLAVTSRDRAATLADYGIMAPVVPYGYDAALAGEPVDPACDRDIDVLLLASAVRGVPTRRARITTEVLETLGPAVRTLVVDDGLWGAERRAVLRRARIVLNVNRIPGNFTGIRSVLAGAAGALVVSEPISTPEPFAPGVHYVEAPAERLAATIIEWLADPPGRISVARAAQTLLLETVTMRRSVERLLEVVG